MRIGMDHFEKRFDELIKVFRSQTSGINEFIELRVIEKICQIIRDTANKLGYTRLGNNVLSALTLGIQYAQIQGGITTGTNGTFVLSAGGTARAEATLNNF